MPSCKSLWKKLSQPPFHTETPFSEKDSSKKSAGYRRETNRLNKALHRPRSFFFWGVFFPRWLTRLPGHFPVSYACWIVSVVLCVLWVCALFLCLHVCVLQRTVHNKAKPTTQHPKKKSDTITTRTYHAKCVECVLCVCGKIKWANMQKTRSIIQKQNETLCSRRGGLGAKPRGYGIFRLFFFWRLFFWAYFFYQNKLFLRKRKLSEGRDRTGLERGIQAIMAY